MPEPPFLDDARAICVAPFLQLERRREAVRQAHAQAEVRRGQGVSWAGLGAGPLRPPRAPGEIQADAEAALTRAQAFAASPRGRFLRGIRALEQLGCAAHAETALKAFARGFADPDRTASPAEIGVALAALARLDQAPAHQARVALAELLSESLNAAA